MTSDRAYDVGVVGGGPAGVAAAAAACAGSPSGRVILIEQSTRLGGSVTAAMHRSLCGLYAAAPREAVDTLNSGVQRRVIERMVRHDPAAVRPREFGKVWVLEFPASAWEAALGETCAEAGVEVRLGCHLGAVRRAGDRITALQIQGETHWLDVRAVIDCTGGGAVLGLGGDDVALPRDPADGRMLGGYALRLGGLSGNLELLRLEVPYTLARAVQCGALPPEARFAVFYPGPGDAEGVCKLAIRPADFGDSGGAVELADRVLAHLMREVGGFAAARVVERSPHALPRDGRQLRGHVAVTEEDVLSARKHGPDSVHAWWPVERWDAAAGPTYAYPPVGEHYDVPAGALRSAAIENLLAAGMCVSATPGAAASIRASGICLATGDLAGRMAAGIAAK